MPAYSRITELQLKLSCLEREIDRLDNILSNVDHMRSERVFCPINSPRDVYLSNLYHRIDDRITTLQGIWQDISDEIDRLLNA